MEFGSKLSFPQSRPERFRDSGVGNLSEKEEGFRTSLPAAGGATGDQGRNDKHAHTYEFLRK